MGSKKEWSLGIDIGGTKTLIGVVDSLGQMIYRELIKTNRNPCVLVEDVLKALTRMGVKSKDLLVTGVGIAGQVEKETGVLHFAPNLDWHDVPLASQLGEVLKTPVKITNDVRAATWGEWLYGAGKDCTDLVCLFFGTGIGSGIVSGGQMLLGTSNTAGELGHITLDLHGPLCACGNHGCFEAIAGGRGIERRAKEVILSDPSGSRALLELVNGNTESITAQHIFDAWRAHVPAAMKVVEEAIEGMIAGVASIINALNPARIILGGGIIQGNLELAGVIRKGILTRALKAPSEKVEIVTANLAGEAGVIGAAAFARRNVQGETYGK